MKGAIRIIGHGAVGKALAHSLSKASPSLSLSLSLYGRYGVEDSFFKIFERGALYDVSLPRKVEIPDLVFVTTKAYDIGSALMNHLKDIPETSPIIFLCNGYIEPLLAPFRSAYPHHRFVKGLVTRGAKFRSDGVLELSDEGKIAWGNTEPVTPLELEIFLRVPELQHDPKACRNRKIKWYCNTVVNTLSGAHRLPANGEVLSHPDYEPLKAEVYRLLSLKWPGEFPDEKFLSETLDSLVVMTKDNENSMARDVRMGRPLEIDVLSGTVKSVENAEEKFPLLMTLHRRLENQKI